MNLLSKALEYSSRGYSVIPIRKDKVPAIASWKKFQTAPADDAQLEAWWKNSPSTNIGIVTGKISGITVVDIDTNGDKQVSLDAFPQTYTVKTPTGGYHLYYEYEPSIQQTANTFPQFPHVDIRNDGGYVIAPPSETDYIKGGTRISGAYSIERKLPLAKFPTALFINKPQPQKAAQLLKAFKGMEEGDGRNNALAKVIGRFLKVLPHDEFETTAWEMTLAANSQFKKPLPRREVKATFDSILKRERMKPLSKVEFLKDNEGNIIVNEENVYRTVQADKELVGMFRNNTFAGVLESKFANNEWQPLQKVDIAAVQMYLMRTYPHFVRVKSGTVESALLRVMKENPVSLPMEWLLSLVWDQKPRLDTWLSHTYGVEDNEYHRAVGSNWMKGLVKRLVYPGCKFDYVLVLEGKQGIKKSTSLAILGGQWHVETTFTPDNKDFFMIMGGNAIVEFSEGETLSRTETKKLKAIITMQHDRYRVPFDRSVQNFPRQCVFAMTTNQEQYLKDETGNRRWLPVAVQNIVDTDWLTENREQLFAEAYHRVVTLKEKTYEFPEEATLLEQQKRQLSDPRKQLIYEWYFSQLTASQRKEGITTHQAYIQAIHKGSTFGKEMSRSDEMILGSILRDDLKLDRVRSRESGKYLLWKYFPSKATYELAPEDAEMTEEMRANVAFNDF